MRLFYSRKRCIINLVAIIEDYRAESRGIRDRIDWNHQTNCAK